MLMCILQIKNLFNKLKTKYNDPRSNPEIVVLKPFSIEEQLEPIPFELKIQTRIIKGFILRQDDRFRKIGFRGNSNSLTLPSGWQKNLGQLQKAHLVQIQNQKELAVWFFPEQKEVSA